jgi:galactokinase
VLVNPAFATLPARDSSALTLRRSIPEPPNRKMPPPTVIAFAQGRVELLCNHPDYNEGVALAAAMDRGVGMGAEKLGADLVEVSSETKGREVSASLKELQRIRIWSIDTSTS